MAEGNRRHQHNLQGVLRLAVDAGSASDGPTASEPMSQERLEFLRGALAEVCKGQMDEVEQMKQCVSVLLRDDGEMGGEEGEKEEEEEDEREAVLDLLSDLCENLDNARGTCMGGLEVCLSRCFSPYSLPYYSLSLFLSETVLCMGMVQQLVAVLRSPHSAVHEHVVGVLCCLVEESERGVSDCTDPSLGLEELLNQKVKELKGREESQEELEFCERLRAACFRRQPQEDGGMDR
uniref:Nucleotide exchange factor Fes1 domain-containing protein n=1 Tax=Astyanax mexicanus TaxID=7994 RepID=A0A8B9JHQ3_ASTMX